MQNIGHPHLVRQLETLERVLNKRYTGIVIERIEVNVLSRHIKCYGARMTYEFWDNVLDVWEGMKRDLGQYFPYLHGWSLLLMKRCNNGYEPYQIWDIK